MFWILCSPGLQRPPPPVLAPPPAARGYNVCIVDNLARRNYDLQASHITAAAVDAAKRLLMTNERQPMLRPCATSVLRRMRVTTPVSPTPVWSLHQHPCTVLIDLQLGFDTGIDGIM